VALPEAKENPGLQLKRELYEKKNFFLCNRLASKIDRGFTVEEKR